MARLICVETEDGEVFVNIDLVCRAEATPDTVKVEFANGKSQTFADAAAHALIQALRHEEKLALRNE